jgi:hypothetical protein
MKKLCIIALLVIATASAFAQGSVNFRNDVLPASQGALVYLGAGTSTPLEGANYFVQLYFGAPNSTVDTTFTALTTAASKFRAAGVSPGQWSGATRTIPGYFNNGGATDPKAVSLQVRVWDSTLGTDYATAFGAAGGNFTGKSAIFQYSIPDSTQVNAPSAFYMTGLGAFSVAVPEPSVIVLGLLGASALLFRRRK